MGHAVVLAVIDCNVECLCTPILHVVTVTRILTRLSVSMAEYFWRLLLSVERHPVAEKGFLEITGIIITGIHDRVCTNYKRFAS